MTDKAFSELAEISYWLHKIKEAPNHRRYKLLIVDDQPEIRNLLTLTLDSDDYEVHHANDWTTALEITKTVKPDLILLDIMMPGEHDGLEVCRRIKNDKDLSSTIIIIVSARSQAADQAEGFKAGADDYLAKPFSPLSLIDKVGTFLTKTVHTTK